MKKTIFSLAVLAALASCARTESYVPVAESADIQLTINAKTPATKAEFNGTDAIEWNEMDAIHLAIASAENPSQAIKVSGSSGGYATIYLANFTLQDNTADVPQFKGYFYSLDPAYINLLPSLWCLPEQPEQEQCRYHQVQVHSQFSTEGQAEQLGQELRSHACKAVQTLLLQD